MFVPYLSLCNKLHFCEMWRALFQLNTLMIEINNSLNMYRALTGGNEAGI